MVAGRCFHCAVMVKKKDGKVDVPKACNSGGEEPKVIVEHEGASLDKTISPSTLASAVSYHVTV